VGRWEGVVENGVCDGMGGIIGDGEFVIFAICCESCPHVLLYHYHLHILNLHNSTENDGLKETRRQQNA
jgi:hypothetical protein